MLFNIKYDEKSKKLQIESIYQTRQLEKQFLDGLIKEKKDCEILGEVEVEVKEQEQELESDWKRKDQITYDDQ